MVLPGKPSGIPYEEFTVGTTRFDRRRTKILTVYVESGNGSSKMFICPGPICRPLDSDGKPE